MSCLGDCLEARYRERIEITAQIWQSGQSSQQPQQQVKIQPPQIYTIKTEKKQERKKFENEFSNAWRITNILLTKGEEEKTKARDEKIKIIKENLKSKSIFSIKREVKNREREATINSLLEIQEKITRFGDTVGRQKRLIHLQNKLLRIASKRRQRGFETMLNELCGLQIELTRLQMAVEDLQREEKPRITRKIQNLLTNSSQSNAELKAQILQPTYGTPGSSK